MRTACVCGCVRPLPRGPSAAAGKHRWGCGGTVPASRCSVGGQRVAPRLRRGWSVPALRSRSAPAHRGHTGPDIPGVRERGCSSHRHGALSLSIHLLPCPFPLSPSRSPRLEKEAHHVPLKCRVRQTCQPLRGLWPYVPPPRSISLLTFFLFLLCSSSFWSLRTAGWYIAWGVI